MSNDTKCTPVKALRCWQYRKDSDEPIPRWAARCLEWPEGAPVKFIGDSGEEDVQVDDRDWLVEQIGGTDIFDDRNFRESFELCAQATI